MEKTALKIPSDYSEAVKEMWQDDKGFWAAASPGYCFAKPAGYTLRKETEEELISGLMYLKPEQFEIRDAVGQMVVENSFEVACKLLQYLRPDYSIVSSMTGEKLENIRPDIYRKRIEYSRHPHKDDTACYVTPTRMVYAKEQYDGAGHIQITGLDGQVAIICKEWVDMPKEGLSAFCFALERQINHDLEQKQRHSGTLPVLSISGDPKDVFMAAVLKLQATRPYILRGLIEVTPVDGEALTVAKASRQQLDLHTADAISHLLQDSGFEDASKFLDCHFEL